MKESSRILLRLFGYLRPYGPQVFAAYVAMLAVTGLTLVVPAILGWVVDVALTPATERTAELVDLPRWLPGAELLEQYALRAEADFLVVSATVLIVLALVRAVFAFAQMYLGAWLSQRAAYDIRNAFFRHVQRQSFRFHDRTQTGDLMSRAVSDISSVQRFLGEGLIEAVNIPVLFVAVAVVLFGIDSGLAIVAFSPVIVLVIVTVRFGRLIEPRFKAVQEQEGVISTRAQENFSGMRVVKAFAREAWENALFHDINMEYLRRRIWVIGGFATYFPLMSALVAFALALLLWYGGERALAGELSVGTLVSFNFWIVMLAMPTQNLGFIVNRASEAIASGRRFFEIVDSPTDIVEAPDAHDLPRLRGRVEFEHVDFQYAAHDGPQVLHDIDFAVEPNTIVALFGPTGAGKTSVVNLIPRFYDASAGAVKVDGHDVRDVTLGSLRSQISMVLQDTFLFSATIRDNITYGRHDADEAAVIAAARAAGAHDFISALPQGYDTLIGERGVNLSGGQRQRVSIARALITDPRILILDDATSAVDTETEHHIQAALKQLMANRTTFVIAQRLVTLKSADIILVMDHGRIVERGSHADLVDAGGLYARMYELQLRDQEAAAGEARRSSDAPGEAE
jgi:ATP-binding cassette, subfamily B, multidrug efflux pump